MISLAAQRCLNHETREAVCRCPQCRNYFCRECVVAFEARMLCGACLALAVRPVSERPKKSQFAGIVIAAVGFLTACLLFYLAGWAIIEFHDRTASVEDSVNLVSTA